jgi:hypothetical protein
VNLVPNPLGLLAANAIPASAYNPPALGDPQYSFSDWLFTSTPGLFGMVGGIANPTGVALMIILTIIFISSMAWVRKGGYFEVGKGNN